jgi:uncharacterized protein with ATP-grasp and redox domains
MKEACGILCADLTDDISSAEIATTVHKNTYEILGSVDPYETVKEQAMAVGLELQSKAESIIDNSTDKLHAAVLCSIVGNVLDFGISGGVATPADLVASFDAIFEEGLQRDDLKLAKKYLKSDSKVLFFADNCGEIVFDKLLCRELKSFGVKIVMVVKGEPILSDATIKECEQINLGEVVDEIITAGEYAVGLSIKNIPPELKEHLESAELIISKGMANYEALSETNLKPILYLLRTKCAPVAASIGESKDINVAKLFE